MGTMKSLCTMDIMSSLYIMSIMCTMLNQHIPWEVTTVLTNNIMGMKIVDMDMTMMITNTTMATGMNMTSVTTTNSVTLSIMILSTISVISMKTTMGTEIIITTTPTDTLITIYMN